MTVIRVLCTALLVLLASPSLAIDTSADNVQAFVDRMVSEHGFDRASLIATLGRAERKDKILEAISRPAEGTLSWGEYRGIFLTEERIEAGAAFWREQEDELTRIAEATGVPMEILVGIIGVETYFGRITGSYRVLDALATLAFHYPRRSAFFTRELEQFLLLVRSEELDATEPTGSYAGAMGRPQFMPSSYRAYAVDSTGDGKRDIWNDWEDVAGSIANYFLAHQWRPGDDVAARASLSEQFQGPVPKAALKPSSTVAELKQSGVEFTTGLEGDDATRLIELDGESGPEHWVGFHNFFVITRYNRSVMYALAVHQLGQDIADEVARGES
ncbi:MAG: lytic murein transglycosylase B [Pseudomonadota bacterium]